jgi:sporulation protein YlmC with PRC-barrel domain
VVAVLRLSDLLGRRVIDADGRAIGRLIDIVTRLEPHPRAVRLRIKQGRRAVIDVDWGDVADVDLAGVHVRAGTAAPATLADYELLLERHVLDAQIVDLAGKRLTRVADVELVLDGRVLSVQGVEVGLAPLLRRLGLRFLVGHSRSSSIRWTDLRLTSERGRRVQLAVIAPTTPTPASHPELVNSLVPEATHKRFRLHWIRRRAPA